MPVLPLPLLALQSALLSPRALTTTGPHAALVTTHPQLNHTIYTPANLSTFTAPVPAVIWANDACTTTTTTTATGAGRVDPYEQLNREVASWGFVVFACGAPGAAVGVFGVEGADAGSDAGVQTGAGVQAANEEEEKRAWANVERTGFGMLGSRCGGAGVYAAAEDARVLSLAVLDIDGGGDGAGPGTVEKAANVTKPVFYFSIPDDSAADLSSEMSEEVEGVKAEFNAVAQGVPAWYGFLPGVDGEVVKEGGAGKLGRAVRFWASWMLKGEEGRSGSAFFTEEGAEGEGWTGKGKGLGVLVL